jgi:CBS domain-containing protein
MKTTDASGVAARLASVTVREVMHEGLITCAPKTPLDELAHLMASRRVHAILTTDDADEQQTWGVVSDLDLVSVASADMFGATAADASTTEVITVALDETVERAAQLMSEHGVTHLLVVDGESERPVGVLSTLDVARVIAGHRGASAPAVHVADVMQTEVVTVAPSTGLQDVARTPPSTGSPASRWSRGERSSASCPRATSSRSSGCTGRRPTACSASCLAPTWTSRSTGLGPRPKR